MTRSRPAVLAPPRATAVGSVFAAWLHRLAPYLCVAAFAYPTLVWPLLEAEVVSLSPVYGAPAVDGPPSALLRVYFSTIFVLSLLALMLRDRTRPLGLFQPTLVLLAAYVGWAGVTGFWAVEPEISTRRFLLAVFIAGTIVAATLATRDSERLTRIAFWMFAAMVAISLASVLTTQPTALGHAAFYPHKNYFAAITTTMMLFALYKVASGTRAERVVGVVMLALGAWFLVEARSKTSSALIFLVPPLGYGAAYLAHLGRISPAIVLPLLAVSVYGGYQFGAVSGLWDFHAMAETIFGDPSLTQRTDIWNFALKKIAERPWLGYGYEVFWGAGVNSPSVREGPGFVAQMPHAHNGYIDMVLQTGLVGLAIFAALALVALHSAGRLARTAPLLAGFALSLIVYALLYDLLETAFFKSFGLKSMTMILGFVIVSQRPGRSR